MQACAAALRWTISNVYREGEPSIAANLWHEMNRDDPVAPERARQLCEQRTGAHSAPGRRATVQPYSVQASTARLRAQETSSSSCTSYRRSSSSPPARCSPAICRRAACPGRWVSVCLWMRARHRCTREQGGPARQAVMRCLQELSDMSNALRRGAGDAIAGVDTGASCASSGSDPRELSHRSRVRLTDGAACVGPSRDPARGGGRTSTVASSVSPRWNLMLTCE